MTKKLTREELQELARAGITYPWSPRDMLALIRKHNQMVRDVKNITCEGQICCNCISYAWGVLEEF